MMQMMQQRMQAPGNQAPAAESRPSRCKFTKFENFFGFRIEQIFEEVFIQQYINSNGKIVTSLTPEPCMVIRQITDR